MLAHAVLPALALGLLTAGVFLRLVRTNVIGTLGHATTSRRPGPAASASTGSSRKHAYRPALIPIITVIGLQIALLLGGAVLTETTFEWKGLGFQLAAVPARPATSSPCRASSCCSRSSWRVTNFIVDIIAALIDPRVRY